MFRALRTEVEALFMTGPTVSLEAVSTELQNIQAHVANEVRAHFCHACWATSQAGLIAAT